MWAWVVAGFPSRILEFREFVCKSCIVGKWESRGIAEVRPLREFRQCADEMWRVHAADSAMEVSCRSREERGGKVKKVVHVISGVNWKFQPWMVLYNVLHAAWIIQKASDGEFQGCFSRSRILPNNNCTKIGVSGVTEDICCGTFRQSWLGCSRNERRKRSFLLIQVL